MKKSKAKVLFAWPVLRAIGIAAIAGAFGMLAVTSVTLNAQAPDPGATEEADDTEPRGETKTCGRLWRECTDLVFEYERLIGEAHDKVQACSYTITTSGKEGSTTEHKVDQGCFDHAVKLSEDLMASRDRNADKCERRRVLACEAQLPE
ncbi:MAG: hypothetical protein ABIJ96_04295 [Elusimicrobiota bacterium]